MSDLKPCPFCGATADAKTFPRDAEFSAYVVCWKCGTAGPPREKGEAAIEAWNTRPVEDAKDAEIARLRKMAKPLAWLAENTDECRVVYYCRECGHYICLTHADQQPHACCGCSQEGRKP